MTRPRPSLTFPARDRSRVSEPAGAGRLTTHATATANALLLDLAASSASASLREAGVRSILLKGPVLARWLYTHGAVRAYTDVDLLIPRPDTEVAIQALAAAGYCDVLPSATERGATPHARVLQAPMPAATGIGGSSGTEPATVELDLHWSFHGIGVTDLEFWEAISSDAGELSLFGVSVDVPALPASAMLVALHVTAHSRDQTSPFSDLDRALAKASDDVSADAGILAERLDAVGSFVSGLRMNPAGVALARRLRFEADADPALRVRAGVPLARGLERLAQTESARRRMRLIARELFPTPPYLRAWSSLARRGRTGLALAYAHRPLWLLGCRDRTLAGTRGGLVKRFRVGGHWRRSARTPGPRSMDSSGEALPARNKTRPVCTDLHSAL